MVDNQGRIRIPDEFLVPKSDKRKAYFYYSPEEELFYLLFQEDTEGFLTAIRNVENKNRVYVPKEIFKMYCSKSILLAKKGNRYYLLPLKKEE